MCGSVPVPSPFAGTTTAAAVMLVPEAPVDERESTLLQANTMASTHHDKGYVVCL